MQDGLTAYWPLDGSLEDVQGDFQATLQGTSTSCLAALFTAVVMMLGAGVAWVEPGQVGKGLHFDGTGTTPLQSLPSTKLQVA